VPDSRQHSSWCRDHGGQGGQVSTISLPETYPVVRRDAAAPVNAAYALARLRRDRPEWRYV